MNWKRLENRNQRNIIERIIVKGLLILDTPTGLGNGDTEGSTDLVILRDSLEDKALLMGSSIGGALRNYLCEVQSGYNKKENTLLFGGLSGDDEGEQSPLIINDSLSSDIIKVELRDGVKINSQTGTALDKYKYDLELLEAGTKFRLFFELLISENDDRERLIQELLIVCQGLENSEISIGMKKRRGFGRCHVEKWQVWRFELDKFDQLIKWLKFKHWETEMIADYPSNQSISKAFSQVKIKTQINVQDQRCRLIIKAKFTLVSSLLIGSLQPDIQKSPDEVHLKSQRNNEFKSILSGTSLAGVLRHRAERIINTLALRNEIIDELFGFVKEKDNSWNPSDKNLLDEFLQKAQASRLIVNESVINEPIDLVQTRIAIDRFTGGTLHGALWQEQPIFPNEKTNLELEIELRQPKDYEIGLLILLLKDLWTGDLPVGSTSSIGRGRLQGQEGTITWQKPSNSQEWQLVEKDHKLQVKDMINRGASSKKVQKKLQDFIEKLHQEVR